MTNHADVMTKRHLSAAGEMIYFSRVIIIAFCLESEFIRVPALRNNSSNRIRRICLPVLLCNNYLKIFFNGFILQITYFRFESCTTVTRRLAEADRSLQASHHQLKRTSKNLSVHPRS